MKKLIKSLFASNSNNRCDSRLRLETLEDRQMLSATPIEVGATVDESANAAIVAPMVATEDDSIDLGDLEEEEVEVVTVNLADYDAYSTYVLKEDGLYGQKKVGKEVVEEMIEVEAEFTLGAAVVVNGQAKATEKFVVDSTALATFSSVEFNGGSGNKDSLSILGTEEDENFSVNMETKKSEVPVYSSNPYEKTMENYAKLSESYAEKAEKAYDAGKDSLGDSYMKSAEKYENLYLKYSDKWDALKEKTKTVTNTYNSVSTFEEDVEIVINEKTGKESEKVVRTVLCDVIFTGVKAVSVDAGEGEDTIEIVALKNAYTFANAETMDFTSASKTVNFDIAKTSKQTAISGDSGTITMKDEADLFMFAGKQTIKVSGSGDYAVQIENGGKSIFNAFGLDSKGSLTILGSGDNVTVNGGKGTINIGSEDEAFVGNSLVLNCAATAVVNAFVDGDKLIANTGSGADFVTVWGDNATINTNNGNDQVFVWGGGAKINLGRGDDLAVVRSRDEKGAKVGGNTIHGNDGQDIIFLAETSGKNYLYGDAGNDVIIGGEGTDYIYGVSGKNILFGMGGSDYINGSSKADIMVANTTDAVSFDLDTYDAIYEAWVENSDEDAAMDILGLGTPDDAKDYLYTYKRSGDLIAANETDDDFIGGGVDADDEWIFLKK